MDKSAVLYSSFDRRQDSMKKQFILVVDDDY